MLVLEVHMHAAEIERSGAMHHPVRVEHTRLHRRDRRHRLELRAGRILGVERAVEQRIVLRRVERFPHVGVDRGHEHIRVISGMGRHPHDVAGLHVHDHAGLHRVRALRHRRLQRGLHFRVDAHAHIVAVGRRVRDGRGTRVALGRRRDHELAVLADEVLVVNFLEAGLTFVAVVDHVTAKVLAPIALLVAREIAEHVRELRALRVDAQRRGLEAKALRLESRRLYLGDLVRREILHHHQRLVTLRAVLRDQVGIADVNRGTDDLLHFINARPHPLDDVGVSRGFIGAGPAENEVLLRGCRGVDRAVGGKDVTAQAGHFVLGQRRDDVRTLVDAHDLVAGQAGLIGLVEHGREPVAPFRWREDGVGRSAARGIDLVFLQVDENVARRRGESGQSAQRAGGAVDLNLGQLLRHGE